MEKQYPTLQAVANGAYAIWKKHPNWDTYNFHKQLDPIEELAVLTDNMNSQVENGGWYQWFDNGYGKLAISYLQEHLPQVGETGMVVAQMLVEIERVMEAWEPEVLEWQEDIWFDEEIGENVDDSGYVMVDNEEGPDIDRFDSLYYAINSALLSEIECVLQKPRDEIIALLEAPTPNPVEPETPERPILRGPVDGNIFAVMGAAGRALQRAGKHDEASKMVERVSDCGSYPQALGIIQEYVEIRL